MSVADNGTDPALHRSIGRVGAAMLALNGMVGAGIFALPGTLALASGAASSALLALFGGLMIVVALPIARIASFYDRTGGPVAYAREAFGPWASFQVGWIYYIARVAALAANANVLVDYAGRLWPAIDGPSARTITLAGLFAALTIVNVVGLKRAILALDIISLFKFVPLIVLAVVSLAWFDLESSLALPRLSDAETAGLVVLYAFIGFENALIAAGETKDARSTLPKVLIGSLVATVLLYILVQVAYVSVMRDSAEGEAPLVAFGEALAGPAGAWAVTLIALVSITGNALGAMAAVPRVTYALARDRLLPSWFGRVHPTYESPARSIIFAGLLAAALAVTGSFVALAVVATLARVIVYLVSIAALPVVVRKRAEARMGIGWSTVAVAGSAICVAVATQASGDAWIVLGGLLLVGTPLLLWKVRAREGGRG